MKAITRMLLAASFASLIATRQPIVISPLANGSNSDPIKIKAKGPTTIEQDRLTFQAGADTGWHTHPGPASVVVTRGGVNFVSVRSMSDRILSVLLFLHPKMQFASS